MKGRNMHKLAGWRIKWMYPPAQKEIPQHHQKNIEHALIA